MLELPSKATERTWTKYVAARDQAIAALRDHEAACVKAWEMVKESDDDDRKRSAMANLQRLQRVRHGEQNTHLLIGP